MLSTNSRLCGGRSARTVRPHATSLDPPRTTTRNEMLIIGQLASTVKALDAEARRQTEEYGALLLCLNLSSSVLASSEKRTHGEAGSEVGGAGTLGDG